MGPFFHSICDPFFKDLHLQSEGTGLGLSARDNLKEVRNVLKGAPTHCWWVLQEEHKVMQALYSNLNKKIMKRITVSLQI